MSEGLKIPGCWACPGAASLQHPQPAATEQGIVPNTCPPCKVMVSRVAGSGPVQNGPLPLGNNSLTSDESDESGETQHELPLGF